MTSATACGWADASGGSIFAKKKPLDLGAAWIAELRGGGWVAHCSPYHWLTASDEKKAVHFD